MGKTDNYFGGIYISLITYNHIVDSRSVLNIAGSIMEPDGADTVTCRATAAHIQTRQPGTQLVPVRCSAVVWETTRWLLNECFTYFIYHNNHECYQINQHWNLKDYKFNTIVSIPFLVIKIEFLRPFC